MRRYLHALILVALLALLVACRSEAPLPSLTATVEPTPTMTEVPTATASPTTMATRAPEQPLYLAIVWHQHQPLYFKDPEAGIYEKPWVRLHATKDYVDMAAILEEYPDVKATFNLTPSLLRQILDLGAGAKDLYQVHTEVPAEELTDDQKAFVRDRFFDINPKIIARFPRYQEIADDRENSAEWDAGTWRDLQVLFNLGWTDPAWLELAPLAPLIEKGRNFSEEDKQVLLEEHRRLTAEVIPTHRRLQDTGRIEITTTPFYHPILPLLVDSNLAREAAPDVELPPQYAYGIDAIDQVQMGIEFYEAQFGRAPRGMWPAEGAVAQEIVNMVAKAGIEWMASDEEVLARSIGKTGFARDGRELVQDAAQLYRPYVVGGGGEQMHIIFRDKVISDKVAFTYSGMEGEAVARDLRDRLLAIRERLNETSPDDGPYLVSIILDGENAWEHYPNDGKAFLHTMYRLLEEEQEAGTIRTVTPSEFIAQYPEQPQIHDLFAGSWVSPDYLTWIGEPEENRAWEYLLRVRSYVARQTGRIEAETMERVMQTIYAAEGSDWFWWYGADQNSGDDLSFDRQFRRTLQRVYEIMDEEVPAFLKVPVIPETAQAPAAGVTDLIAPEIDGVVTQDEWGGAGYYTEEGGVQATPDQIVERLWYGFDTQHLFLRLDARRPWAEVADETRVGFYLASPGISGESFFSRISMQGDGSETLLGFGANMLVEVTVTDSNATATLYHVNGSGVYEAIDAELPTGMHDRTIEVALPYAHIGTPNAGDTLAFRTVVSEGERRDVQVVPSGGPADLLVPDLGLTEPVLIVDDPEGDDHGPGSYVYPLDAVFNPGAYDLTEFAVAQDEENLIFRFSFAGNLNNEWGAPNDMGIHTLDVYVDATEGGARMLLPGRNAALPVDSGWDIVIWAEGWTPGVYAPPAEGEGEPPQVLSRDAFSIVSDAGQNRITVRIAKRALADALGIDLAELDPSAYRYLGVVLGQEGFPSSGVWRVRDVEQQPAQWRFGGAPDDTNHTRIIDVAYPAEHTPTQEDALSDYPASREHNVDTLGPDHFAQLPLVAP